MKATAMSSTRVGEAGTGTGGGMPQMGSATLVTTDCPLRKSFASGDVGCRRGTDFYEQLLFPCDTRGRGRILQQAFLTAGFARIAEKRINCLRG
jgi:hypothetical protein